MLTERATAPETQSLPEPNQRVEIRIRALQPYLDQLTSRGGSEPPSVLVAGNVRIEVHPWAREMIQKTDLRSQDWSMLVAEGFAFRAKCRLDLKVRRGRLNSLPTLGDGVRENLVTDAAVGLALQVDLQRGVNRLVCKGDHGTAKRLSELRNVIGQDLSAIKTLLGGATFGEATKLSESLVRPPEKAPLLERQQETAPRPFKRARQRAQVISRQVIRQSCRPAILLIVMGICLVGWIMFLWTRPPHIQTTILTSSDFRGVRAVDGVSARPPSLFVEMDASDWKSMDVEARRQALEEIGSTAARAGYSGVFAYSTEGVAVGQWLQKRGVRLIEPSPGET